MATRENRREIQASYLLAIIVRGILGWFVGGLVTPTYIALAQDSPSVQTEDKTDILIQQQLIEIQNELRDLRQEVADLRRVVDESTARGPLPDAAEPVNVQIEQDDPVLGDQKAEIAIVEFTDYECPFCEQYHAQTFPQLKKAFVDTGKVQYILRDFPLNFHSQAKSAAIAANCAGKQNAYWQMNNLLFSKQPELGDELYRQSAQSLGLNMEQFLACVNLDAHEEEVSADLAYGQQIGIDGTPTFFVGRVQDGLLVEAKRIVGAVGLEAFAKIINPLLEKQGTGKERQP